MSSTNSTLTLEGLPQPPQGANPFAFYEQGLADSLIRTVDTGFVIRQSILCALLGYTLIVAGANAFVVVRDGRKRGKKFFLWRLLARERGRYIVGNRQFLEPLLTFFVTPFLIAHVANEWVTTFGSGYSDSTGPLRLVPWMLLFIQLWLVSWASLQSFIITASDTTRFVRCMSPRVTNGLFLALGAAMLIMLVVGVCFGIRAGIYLGNALGHTKEALDRAASLWPDVPSAAVQNVVYDWDKVAEARNQTNQASRVVMTAFVVSPFLTATINAGGVALLVLVHRQIGENHRTFNRGAGQVTHFAPVSTSREVVDGSAQAGPSESVTTSPSWPGRPALPMRTSSSTAGVLSAVTLADLPSSPATSEASQGAHVSSSSPSSPTRSSQEGISRPGPSPLSRPSRSAIRRLAGSQEVGLAVAQAQNIQRLQRAEVDLFITSIVCISMAVSFESLALFINLTLNELATTDSSTAEVVLFLGSWLYGAIQAVGLSAQLRSILLNGTRCTPGGHVLDLSSGGGVGSGSVPPMQSRPGAADVHQPFSPGSATYDYMPTLATVGPWSEDDVEAGRRRSEGDKLRTWAPSVGGSRRGSKEEEKQLGAPSRVEGVVVELGEPEPGESSSASERRVSL